jgi:NADPH:quinone reductase
VHASSTNFFDLLQIAGNYQWQPSFPWVAGHEFAGVITALPTSPAKSQPPKFKIGDKVFGSAQGAYSEVVCTAEELIKPVPEGYGLFDAAGLFSTMPTSYAALVTRAKIKKGDWVLVHAAAGGVGLAAVQIAKAFGAHVIATAGTEHKLKVAKEFGADYGINYRDENWPDQVKKITPKGVDIVYDPVGLIDKSMKCIAWCGRLVVIGFVGGQIESIRTNKILLKNISVMGLHWGAYTKNEPEEIANVWNGLFELFNSKKVRGTNYTDKEYVGLESVPQALHDLGARETWGKVVIKVPQPGGSKL